MDIKDALKGQYHAAYRMLADCVERCPDHLWTAGAHERLFWKIAYHAAFFGHLYLVQTEKDFKPWSKHRHKAEELWEEDSIPLEPYTKAELIEYIDFMHVLIDPTIDSLDLDTSDSGFSWYPNITKLEHEMLSVRHVQGHVGQLSERLFLEDIESEWISRRA